MNAKPLNLGFVVAAGGGGFAAASDIARGGSTVWEAVTRVACNAETAATERGIPITRFEGLSAKDFSAAVASHARANGIAAYIFLFDRLVTKEVFDTVPCANIHPSFLPSFAGMDAVKRAASHGVRAIGATAHIIDESIDGGPILGQTVWPISRSYSEDKLNAGSFLQKVLLTLVIVERLERLHQQGAEITKQSIIDAFANDTSLSPSSSPVLMTPRYREGFAQLQRQRDIAVDADVR
jgi:folate-dependent phosphoribosylglycinamide formyltransferase PurN